MLNRYTVQTIAAGLLAFAVSAAAAVPAQPKTTQPAKAEPQRARAVVVQLQARLLHVMQHADKLGYSGRYRQLAPVVRRAFDLPGIARLTVFGYWHKFDHAQRQAFIKALTRLSVDKYARNFDGYDGQQFKIVHVGAGPRQTVKVQTRLVGDDDSVSLDYVLHKAGGSWKIINVIAQGVSNLALKRGQYTGVLKAHGVKGFLKRIESKAKALPVPQ